MRLNPNESNILNASIMDTSKADQSFPSLLKKEDPKYFKVNLDVLQNLRI